MLKKHIHPLLNFSQMNFSKIYLTENKFHMNRRIFFGFIPKFRRLEHFIKTQILSFRFFLPFQAGSLAQRSRKSRGKIIAENTNLLPKFCRIPSGYGGIVPRGSQRPQNRCWKLLYQQNWEPGKVFPCSVFLMIWYVFCYTYATILSFPVDFRRLNQKLLSIYRPMPLRFCRKRLIKFRRCIWKWKCW